jgi:DNA mismatch repair protein MutL
VRDAYRDVLHHGRFPFAFVFLDLDPAQVDVNVHPTKAEVRWRDARFLHSAVGPALRRALRNADLAARAGGDASTGDPAAEREAGVRGAVADYPRRADDALPRHPHGDPRVREPRAEDVRGAGALSVFPVHDSYLVCETPDGIAIVDQHALHERIQYDRILARLTAGAVEAQRLLVPEEVELDARDRALLDEHGEVFRKCGFEWSPFSERSVALEAIPMVVPRDAAAELVRDLIELVRLRGADVDPRTLFHEVADTMACKAAVRFGDRLSREEAAALLQGSGALERAFVCPHGRPTVWRIPFAELEKRFGRR